MSHITGTEHQREAILKHFPPFTSILPQSLGHCQSEILFPTPSEICVVIHISCSKGAFKHWPCRLQSFTTPHLCLSKDTVGSRHCSSSLELHWCCPHSTPPIFSAICTAAVLLFCACEAFQLPEAALLSLQQVLFFFQSSHLKAEAVNQHQISWLRFYSV